MSKKKVDANCCQFYLEIRSKKKKTYKQNQKLWIIVFDSCLKFLVKNKNKKEYMEERNKVIKKYCRLVYIIIIVVATCGFAIQQQLLLDHIMNWLYEGKCPYNNIIYFL